MSHSPFIKRATIAACMLLMSYLVRSQTPDSAYIIYQKQFIELSTTRGVSVNEAQAVLKKFNAYNVSTNRDLARLLGSLYPKNNGTAILMYLFNKDTLRRTLLIPDSVIEESYIPITSKQMFQLGEDLQNALQLSLLTANRAPQERGVSLSKKTQSQKTVSLDTLIRTLTKLLIPRSFTSDYKHLVIIPSLNIGTLPFHILQPFHDGSSLIDKCSFTVAPTLIDFVALRMKVVKKMLGENYTLNNVLRQNESVVPEDAEATWDLKDGLFISNPDYPKNGKYYFPNLQGAEKEIDSASNAFTSPVIYRGAAAIKANIIRSMNGKEVAYFATHGVSSPDNPKDNSFIVLSGEDDPYLTSKQIMDLRLDPSYVMPELVILSACQTGLGKSMEAGISGSLARSFILAGSNHVVTSLWSVDDEATAFMMQRFIYHLKTPHQYNPSEPLRLAILDTKKVFPNPAHWASFILLGIDY
jgi:CHAT domain-containing protein